MKTNQNRIANLKNQIRNARTLQYNASQMRDASGVCRLQRELEVLYRQLDAIVPPVRSFRKVDSFNLCCI